MRYELLGRMDDVSQIASQFGGQRALAAALNVLPSAVSNWKKARRIPPAQKYEIARLAQERQIDLPKSFWAEKAA